MPPSSRQSGVCKAFERNKSCDVSRNRAKTRLHKSSIQMDHNKPRTLIARSSNITRWLPTAFYVSMVLTSKVVHAATKIHTKSQRPSLEQRICLNIRPDLDTAKKASSHQECNCECKCRAGIQTILAQYACLMARFDSFSSGPTSGKVAFDP